MPITANWIWPRYGTPYEIIILIIAMYLSIVLGIISIRVYKYYNLEEDKQELKVQQSDPSAERSYRSNIEIESSIAPGDVTQGNVSLPSPTSKKYVILKYIHSVFMIFSWVMLLGAGQAFLQNARVNGFPYEQSDTVTDSLVGRCYGRNLISPDVPEWLSNITCQFTSMCRKSSREDGKDNPQFIHAFG